MQVVVMELNGMNMILHAWNMFAGALWLRHAIRDSTASH